MNVPVLAYADPTKLYKLHVNVIRDALSGVWYQEYNGNLWPVTYVSRSHWVSVAGVPK